ncbi:hypothetical protein LCX93_03395 [Sulfurimonas sp. SWIR-19]|uniref:hypothetical protein n=1 Tax=Sulfurimonas sp. SWIR-19 TaxID=2878390 RepID=UPI001CF1E81D|nr:hypothetical protein [Sulfurimonas sp. SWIR-19]UCN00977.1 hypothetical protein LCX93_03395 [Sulfurimonas sp. SWIR-19]
MLYYTMLFLAFLYFKIARVYKKEEKSNLNMNIQNTLVFIAIVALLVYGFTHKTWYTVLLASYLFLILASLMVSAVQVGVFIEGKPFVKLSHLYKFLAPIGMLLWFSDVYLWGI